MLCVLKYERQVFLFVLISRLGSMSQGQYFIITVVFIISSFPFCPRQACYRLSEGGKCVESENCLGELLLLELEKQGKTWATQSRCTGIQERRNVCSKGRLRHWLRRIPVPTIPAGSLSERLFVWWWWQRKQKTLWSWLQTMVRSPSSLFLLPRGTLGKEIASCQSIHLGH